MPLFCHPNTYGDLTEKFNSFFAMHILGRPLNCTAALVGLVCGGIFEKFPKLRVAFFECSAEWVVYWMHRMDDDYEWVRDGEASHLKMPPSEYIRRNCYVTCEVDEKLLPMAISELENVPEPIALFNPPAPGSLTETFTHVLPLSSVRKTPAPATAA